MTRRPPRGWASLAAVLLLVGLGPLLAPPSTLAAPLAQTCTPRPPVQVTVVPNGNARLQATISATGAGNVLETLQVEALDNAVLDAPFETGKPPPLTVPLGGVPQVRFFVSQANPAMGATVRLVATDRCGPWRTLVGGGLQAFSTPTPTRTSTPPVAATATATATSLIPSRSTMGTAATATSRSA